MNQLKQLPKLSKKGAVLFLGRHCTITFIFLSISLFLLILCLRPIFITLVEVQETTLGMANQKQLHGVH